MSRSRKMFLYNLRIILLLGVSAIIFSCITAASMDECNRHETCKECIRQPQCSWCSQNDFVNEKRCFNSLGDGVEVMCEHVTNPVVSVTSQEGTLGASYDGRKDSDLAEGEVPRLIQITPLVVNLTLRPNIELTIPVKFKLSKDYPLDVYYLSDSSWSMRTDIRQVALHGANISRVMRNITKNFRLGCGIFADKPVRPFHYYFKGCEQQEGVCRQPDNRGLFTDYYEFQNLLPLKANSSQFREKMMNIKLQGNQDNPEGGLSALMQVLVCKQEIGWRDNSNRLVIYSSDSRYHQAGDGKLGGIVIPNDGQCHLDQEGFYTHAAIMDYPSVSHINYMASKHNTKIIFAITSSWSYKFYKELSREIKGSSFAELEIGSSSVVDLIENEYKKIISHVELNDTSSDLIDVKYRASCSDGAPFVDSQRCSNLKIGSEVNFEVTFKFKECPVDETSRSQTFEIRPSGMNESVIVNVDMICECPCEKEGVQKSAPECNRAGTYQCGVCACDEDYSGWNCECHNAKHDDKLSIRCMPPRNGTFTPALECSGNGVCECGKCRCHNKHITGTYCDCDDRSCRQKDNKPCNGRGTCNCGRCECDLGWSHASPHDPVCDCLQSQDTCLSPANQLVCSGHGLCLCGKCACGEGHAGDYCQVHPLNPELCKNVESCVECLAYGTGPKFDPKNPTNCSDDCSFKLSVDNTKSAEEGYQCYSKDYDGCAYQFLFYYEDMQLRIRAQKEKPKCEKIDILKYIITTTAIGLFVGLVALIAWKLATMTFDRLEYMKFMKEQEKAKWDSAGNPLYRAPTTTIQNPMFQADS